MNLAVSMPEWLMIVSIASVVIGSAAVFWLAPALVFPRLAVDSEDLAMVRGALMALWVMSFGYLMAWAHVFSAPVAVVLLLLTAWFLHRRVRSRYVLTSGNQLSAAVYDVLAQQPQWRAALAAWMATRKVGWDWVPRKFSSYVFLSCALGVLAFSAWLRFAGNWQHAGLFYSDAYETVAWVKGIDVGTLFPNGIYPQGFYLAEAFVQTLTHANVIAFVKFWGAFIGTLLTASVMWSTYRFTGRSVPALLAGAAYGLFPHFLPDQAMRQIAAEGQEFGNLFVLPIAWLVFQSWVTRKRGYTIGASAALAVVGLTHPIALLNAVLAALAATVGGWAVSGISGKVLKQYLWMIPLAATIDVLPLGIAYALGKPLLSSGVTFVTESAASVGVPVASTGPAAIHFGGLVWASLGGIGALFVTKLLWYDDLWEMGLPAVGFLLLLFAELVVKLPHFGIAFAPLVARSGEFLALAEALALGMGAAGIQEAVERVGVNRTGAAMGALAVLVAATGYRLKTAFPRPMTAYTMNTDTFVNTFIRLERTFPNFSWVAVANNGYALAINDGYQYNPSFWIQHVSPDAKWPHFRTAGQKPYSLGQRYVFLFVLRRVNVPDVPGQAQLLAQDRRENRDLKQWVNAWQQLHGPLPVYFQNRDMTVYWIVNKQNPAL